jgi:hypothetical protein
MMIRGRFDTTENRGFPKRTSPVTSAVRWVGERGGWCPSESKNVVAWAMTSYKRLIGSSRTGVTARFGIRSSQQKAGTEWVISFENKLVVPREVRASLDLCHHGGDAGDLRLPDHVSPETRPNDAGVVEGLFGR